MINFDDSFSDYAKLAKVKIEKPQLAFNLIAVSFL